MAPLRANDPSPNIQKPEVQVKNIALLVCNEVELKPPPAKQHAGKWHPNFAVPGDYDKMVHRWLASSLDLVILEKGDNVEFNLDTYDVVQNMDYPPDHMNYDGLFIGGSSFSANDEKEWIHRLIKYIKDLVVKKPKTKLFGFCFGHQIISKALGSTIERKEWEVCVTKVDLTDPGKHLFRTNFLNLQMFHHDQVKELPDDESIGEVHLIGSTEIAPNQGMVILDKNIKLRKNLDSYLGGIPLKQIHVLTLQGHPEYTEGTARNFVADGYDILRDGGVDVWDAHARAGNPTHAITKVGLVIWSVLGVGNGMY